MFVFTIFGAPKDLPWFSSVPVGRNELNKMVQKMCADAGISGKKTNHSLRATGAWQLFQANVPEKVIQERTGHRSLEALRLYEKTTTEQHQAVAQVLGSSATLSYESIVQKQQEITVSPRPPQMAPTLNMSGCTVNIFFNPSPLLLHLHLHLHLYLSSSLQLKNSMNVFVHCNSEPKFNMCV